MSGERHGVLVWQWGRRGAGPRIAAALAEAFAANGERSLLSLSTQAELLSIACAPRNDLAVSTYRGLRGFLGRVVASPLLWRRLARRLRAIAPRAAICAMPAPLDFIMMAALRQLGIPTLVIVHDADLHPGDGLPMQMRLQRLVATAADGLVALTPHVAGRLREQGLPRGNRPLLTASLPPLVFAAGLPPPRAHGGPARLLAFGRLLPYKGLDLLADAVAALGDRGDFELRVVGSGPDSPVLARLAADPRVRVENRWVPEDEVADLLGWADALVLSHREASQSGVAAAAIAAGRPLVATAVGGLVDQLRGEPLARLCDPTAGAIAKTIAGLIDDPPAVAALDPALAWRGLAARLAEGIETLPTSVAATRSSQAATPHARPIRQGE